MALARIRSVERLRYEPAGELGNLIGLDRIPEVRTLRDKIKLLAEPGNVSEWGARLSQDWMEADPYSAGVLYVDGHVRPYYGSQTKLPRRFVSRQRLCLRGTTDYWVNDQFSRPFFVVSTPLTSGLLHVLKNDIVPRLLKDVPNQPSEQELKENPLLHRFIMVFDREGYSPDFFKQMWDLRIACVTYNKYVSSDWPESEFSEYYVTMPGGENVKMALAERMVEKAKGFEMREIRKLTETGHQTSVLSTAYLFPTDYIAAYMFNRWSQENFLKYMMQHFNIDALFTYRTDPVDDAKRVVNPEYRKLDGEIRQKRAKLGRVKKEFGQMTLENDVKMEKIADYEIKKGELVEKIEELEKELEELKEKRKKTEKHKTMGQLSEEERFMQLEPTRKMFMDTIKMIAYRAETAMAVILRDVLARSDDARALAREIFNTEADILPDYEKQELTIRLHHMTNRMSDNAVRYLAEQLTETETVYPGTNLRMIFKLGTSQNP
jgi:prepilin-type processing-associated H-X9-DG protein